MTAFHKILSGLTLIGTLLVAARATQAEAIPVCPDGSGYFMRIQDAIDYACDGDEVVVCDGTYTGLGNINLDFCGKAITVRSANGPANCIIDCQHDGRGFSFVSGEGPQSVVDGFTIRNGFADYGGGVYCGDGAGPRVRNCVFRANSASYGGGGLYAVNLALGNAVGRYAPNMGLTLVDCEFIENVAGDGGGVFVSSYWVDAMIVNCAFRGNAAYRGGALECAYGWPQITGCTFIANSAVAEGGAVGVVDCGATVANCTFADNSADTRGGALYAGLCGWAYISDCVFWQNSAPAGAQLAIGSDEYFAGMAVSYCDVQGGQAAVSIIHVASTLDWGSGSIDADPKFRDSNSGDYRLRADSPCIDAGNNYAVPPDTLDLNGDGDVAERTPLDLDLNPRFVDDLGTIDSGVADLPDYPDVVDMGAFEFQGHTPRTVYVNGATGDDGWDGSCDVWDGGTCGPKLTIQAGIDAALPGDIVEIADGTYIGAGNRDLDFGGKAITVRSASGHAQSCVIDCQGDWLNEHRGFLFDNNEGPDAVVEGLTITNGYGSSSGSTGVVAGGGVLCLYYGNPTFNNCVITGNTADFGGGIYCEDSMPTLNGCTISDNWGWAGGGGLYCIYGGNARLFDCVVSGNYSSDGGGVFGWKSRPLLVSCEISANLSSGYGGGVSSGVSYLTLTNCAFHANTALRGGGLLCDSTTATITNCTFSANSADLGATMFCGTEWSWYPCTIVMSDCILWNGASQIVNNDGSTLTLTYCDVQGGWPGTGNIDADPSFADLDGPDDDANTWTDNDYRLASGSPCIDVGDNAAVPADVLFDLDGLPRITDGDDDGAAVVDMGAYERPAVIIGDMNCDGVVDLDDVNPFVWALLRPAQYDAQHPGCERMFADINADGLVDFGDINPFIELLLGG